MSWWVEYESRLADRHTQQLGMDLLSGMPALVSGSGLVCGYRVALDSPLSRSWHLGQVASNDVNEGVAQVRLTFVGFATPPVGVAAVSDPGERIIHALLHSVLVAARRLAVTEIGVDDRYGYGFTWRRRSSLVACVMAFAAGGGEVVFSAHWPGAGRTQARSLQQAEHPCQSRTDFWHTCRRRAMEYSRARDRGCQDAGGFSDASSLIGSSRTAADHAAVSLGMRVHDC